MLKTFLNDNAGAVAFLAAGSIFAAAAVAAVAVDGGNLYMSQGKLQNTADAAALAAAPLAIDQKEAVARAVEIAQINMPPEQYGNVLDGSDVVFGSWDAGTRAFTPNATPINAVQVTVRREQGRDNAVDTFFAGVLGVKTVDLQATAIAGATTPKPCVIALEPTQTASFRRGGGATVKVPNCGVHVDSSDDRAMRSQGSGAVSAKSICVVGGYHGGGYSPLPETGCDVEGDPLAKMPEPKGPTVCHYTNWSSSGSHYLPGGKSYCGSFSVSGNHEITFGPGIHYFKGADIKVSQNGSLYGDEVMFYFDKDTTVQMSSGGEMKLTAPKSGDFQGVVMFQSRSSAKSKTVKISGSRDTHLDGTIYVPKVNLELTGTGTFSGDAEFGYLIANTLYFTGNVEFRFDSYSGVAPAPLASVGMLLN